MFRQNYDIPISTRVDDETKQRLENIALAKKQKLSELLRDIIIQFVEQEKTAFEMAGLLPIPGSRGE